MPVSSKGQVSIPIAIREQVGLMPNTEVEFDFDGRYVRIRARRNNMVATCR
jgi:AbrB family looped-hinge helix DNA binding protein